MKFFVVNKAFEVVEVEGVDFKPHQAYVLLTAEQLHQSEGDMVMVSALHDKENKALLSARLAIIRTQKQLDDEKTRLYHLFHTNVERAAKLWDEERLAAPPLQSTIQG